MRLPSYPLILLILVLFTTNGLDAQQYVFEYAPSEKYSEKQEAIIEEYLQHSFYSNPVLAEVSDYHLLAKAGKGVVQVQLPDTKEIVSFSFSGGYEDNDGSAWHAETISENGEKNFDGSLFIVTAKDAPNIMGTMNIAGAYYEFMPVDKEYCILYRVDRRKIESVDDCGTGEGKPDQLKPNTSPETGLIKNSYNPPCGRGKITILLMTSPAARAAVPANNINYVINTAVAQLKYSLTNGYVDQDNVEIATVSPVMSTNFLEGIDIEADVQGLDVTFEQDRINNSADLVVMFTNGTQPSPMIPGYDDFNGFAEDIGPNPDAPYAIVQILSATSRTFAHEVGHLLGGRHAGDNTGGSERGKVLTACSPDKATIMCTGNDFSGGANDRVLYFSTPLAFQCGSPVGEATRNVGGFFNANGQTVANYIPNTGNFDFSVWISGPWSTCPCNAPVFWANWRCNEGTINYQWHRSVNGGPFLYVGGTNNYDNWFPCNTPNGTNYVVRLTATDAAGNTSISTRQGQVNSFSCGGGGWLVAPSETLSNEMEVFPNPVSGNQFTIHIPGGLTSGEISVLNGNMQIVERKKINGKAASTNHVVSLNNKPTMGLYFIQVRDAKTGYSKIAKSFVK